MRSRAAGPSIQKNEGGHAAKAQLQAGNRLGLRVDVAVPIVTARDDQRPALRCAVVADAALTGASRRVARAELIEVLQSLSRADRDTGQWRLGERDCHSRGVCDEFRQLA